MDTVLEILKLRSTHAPDKKAYIYLKNGKLHETVSVTYSQLYKRVKLISAALKAKGIKPGDTVLLMYPAGIDFVETFYSCLYLGCIPIPLYPVKNNYSIKRIVAIIKDSAAVFALSTESAIVIQQKIISNNQELDEVAGLTWIATDCIDDSHEPLEQGTENKDIAYLQYTSGSTAAPKGVIISHQNILHNVNLIIDTAKTNQDTVSVMWLPHFHDMGLISGIIQPLVSGYSVYLMSPSDFSLSPYNWLHTITVLKASYSAVPNFALDLCVAKIDDEQLKTLDLSSLNVVFNGAEPIRAASVVQFNDKFKEVGLKESVVSPAYGLAEATLKVTSHDPSKPAVIVTFDKHQLSGNKAVPVSSDNDSAVRLVGCGKIQASQMEVAIVDPVTKEEMANGGVGEIWTSGLSVSQGYWNNQEATDAAFHHGLKNKNGSYLRTGDLGFVLDGELFISGRIKDVIILKGQNYFPQDIENAVLEAGIEALEGCRGALFSLQKEGVEEVVLVHEISRSAMRLDEQHKQETVNQIVKAVAGEFDFLLAEIVFIPFSSLPTTSSGKISRSSAKEQYLNHSLKEIYTWNQKNDTISNIVKDILNLDQVDAEANFFELGLSSIQAMQIAAMASESLGKSIELIDVFKSGSIKKLSQNVGAQVGSFSLIERLEPKDAYEVSSGQRRIWLEEQLLDGNFRKYNESLLFKLSGNIDASLLHAAIHSLCMHHEVLRTGYNMVSGKLVQFIVPHVSFSLDVTELSAKNTEHGLLQYAKRILEPAFDLQHGKVMRAGLLKASSGDCFLVLGIHHIASDGWSKDVFINDLSQLYNGLLQGVSVSLPEPVIQYKDYAHWQLQSVTASEASASRAYWLSRFQEDIPVLELPVQGLRSEKDQYEGGLVPVVLDAELTHALRELAKQHHATLFTILLSFFKTLLYRYTGQSDLVVGTPVSGRTHKQTENLIGFFVNSLALRTELHPSLSFGDNVARVKSTLLPAYEHQHYPFDKLVGELDVVRDHTRNPLFDVMLVLQSNTAHLSFEGVEAMEIANPCPVSKLDITFDLIEEGDQIRGSLVYKKQLFSKAFIEQFGAAYQTLIRSVIAHPEQSIARLPIMSTKEKELLDRFNRTTSAYPSDDSLASLFESQVSLHPAKTALQWHGGQMSYAELSAKTEQLAGLLSAYYEQGCSKQVGVCLSRSPEMVWALVAIVRSGGAYVPIDPHYPSLRIKHIIQDGALDLIFTSTEHTSLFKGEQVKHILNLEDKLPEMRSALVPPTVDDLAYILYTSGSTGNPKGAMLHHAGVVNRLHWQWHYCRYTEDDIILQKTPFTFDVSVWEFFLPLCYGATLALARQEKVLSPEDLLSDISTFKVSNLHFVPTMYNVFLESVHQNKSYDLSSLRSIINSGEALSASTGRYSYEQLPDVVLYNLYGPTEASIDVSAYIVKAGDTRIPIGHPIANTRLYVLDEQLEAVPVGVHGEICISGIGLASGYRNLADQTKQSFVDNPHESEAPYHRLYKTGDIGYWTEDGNLMYVSRKDSQVKLRGFRIELGEIETAIRSLAGVSDAVVVTTPISGTTVLIAYIISGREITLEHLRKELSSRLPDYMLPSYVLRLEAFPLSQSGKLSRKQLPLPELSSGADGEKELPQTEKGKVIAACWSKTLNREEVGIYEDFFSIGGDSIKAMQVVGELAQKGWKLSLKDLMNHPTIHDLEEKLSGIIDTAAFNQSGQHSGLSPIEHWFFEQQFEQEHFWNQGVVLSKESGFDVNKVEESFRIICQQHEQLRARFVKDSGKMKRVISDKPDDCFHLDYAEENGNNVSDGSSRLVEWQEKGNLQAGPLIKILALTSENKVSRLVISIHHLLIDGISWRILLEDFERTYDDLLYNRAPVFVKTIEFSEWVNALEGYAERHFSEQVNFWNYQLNSLEKSLPESHKNTRYKTKDHIKYTHTIKGSKSEHAFETIQNKGFALHELLLSSLANAYALKTAEPSVFWVEGHGRFDCGKDIDLSKTIGWFTSLYPVLIQNESSIVTLQKTQKQLRNIPDQGQGYLWLKNSLNAFAEATDMPVCFNYLGDLSETNFSFKVDRLSVDAVVSRRSHRPFKLEVVAFKQQQDIVVEFYYAEDYLSPAVVKEMAFHVEELFEETVALLEKNDLESWYVNQPVAVPLVPDLAATHQAYPLTDIQMSYLIGRESGFELGGVSTVNYLEIDTLLDIDKLSVALNELIVKHPMLRTVIHANGTQQILPEVPVYTIEKTDLTRIPELEKTAILHEKRLRGIGKNFKPDVWPLFEFTAYRISDRTHRLLINYDLMIIDAGSSFILFEDLLNHYTGNPYRIPATDFTFRDYLLNSHQLEARQEYLDDKAYWQNKVEDFPAAPVLPVIEDLSEIENPVFAIEQQVIDAKTWQEFKKQAKKARTTPSALLMTVFSEIMGYWSNSTRFSLNLSVNERQMIHPDVEYLVGEFTSTILLDIDFRACRNFWQKAGKVQENLFEALEHKSYSGVKFIQDLSLHHKTSGKAMMPIVFTSVLNSSRHTGVIENLGTQNFIHTKTSQVMMDFQVIERGEELQLVFGYVSQLFSREMIEHIFKNFISNVHSIATTGDAKPVIGLERHMQLWESYNNSRVPVPETNLLDLFRGSVKQFSSKTAIECEEESISYSTLNDEANRVASYLRQQNVKKGDLVAVSGNREIGTVINIFGILKAGAAYVPVDPEYPERRRKQILESCRYGQVLNPDLYKSIGNAYDAAEFIPDIKPADVAYVIFTSGSTGNPKGVVIQHGAAANTILDMNVRFSVTSEDKVLGISSLGFDLSVYDIFGTFACGGTLVILKDQRDTVEISEKITKHGITVWNSVPAIMNISYEEIRRRELMQKKMYWNSAVTWRLQEHQLLIDEKMYGEYEKQLFPDFYFYMKKGSSVDDLFERFSAYDRVELRKFTDKLIENGVVGTQPYSFRKDVQRYVRLYDTFDKRIRYDESVYKSFKTRKLNRSNEKHTGPEITLSSAGPDRELLEKRKSVRVYDAAAYVPGDILKKAVAQTYTELMHQVNALELCVYVKDKRVSGIKKGFYRYSVAGNSFGQVSVEALSPDCFSDFNKPIVESSAFVFFFSSNGADDSTGRDELYQAGLLSARLMWYLQAAGLGSCYIGDFNLKLNQALRHLPGQRTIIACVGGIEDQADNTERNYDLKIGVNAFPDAEIEPVSGTLPLYYWSAYANWEIKEGTVFINDNACPLLSAAVITEVYFSCQSGCAETTLLEACKADRSVVDFLVGQNILVRDVSLTGLVKSGNQHKQAQHGKAIDFLVFSALLSCFSQDRSGEAIRYNYPSGGGLYPIDLYVKIGKQAVKGLREGLYYFNPARNSISYCSELSNPDDALVEMYYVYDASVNVPRYGATGVEFSLIEAGIMNATLTVAADGLGLEIGSLALNDQVSGLPLNKDQVVLGSVIIHPEKIPHAERHITVPAKLRSSALRLVLLSGDWIPLELPGKIQSIFPDAAIYSLGGATEASIWSIYYPITEIDAKWKSIPYGMPLGNQTIYVIGHDKQPCAPGVEGDIYIGGAGLAKEYLGDTEKTNAAFINHPVYGRLYLTGDMGIFHEQGYVEFRGRKDTQAKVRGFRIELGEILYHLTSHPVVEGALVELIEDDKGEKEICAYVISKVQDEAVLRKGLSALLPYYMVPKYIVFMKEFPLTANGKIDKNKLAKPELRALDTDYVKPANAQEELLERTICEVMGLEKLSIDTNFFEIGCSSIQLMKIYQELNRYYPQKLRIVDFFTNTSIRSLSSLIGSSEQAETSEYIEIEI